MKKLLIVILAVSTILLIFASCGTETTEETDPESASFSMTEIYDVG